MLLLLWFGVLSTIEARFPNGVPELQAQRVSGCLGLDLGTLADPASPHVPILPGFILFDGC